jgi:hypothetical protein
MHMIILIPNSMLSYCAYSLVLVYTQPRSSSSFQNMAGTPLSGCLLPMDWEAGDTDPTRVAPLLIHTYTTPQLLQGPESEHYIDLWFRKLNLV